jgi:hypothetical protein
MGKVELSKLAASIDAIRRLPIPMLSFAAEGYRAYVSKNKENVAFNDDLVKAIQRFIEGLRLRISIEKISRSKPNFGAGLSTPFHDIGYSLEVEARFKVHRDHSPSSHAILNIFDAVAQQLYGKKYILHQFVLFPIWEYECMTSLAEKTFPIRKCHR